jgi:peptide chain release factor
METKFIQITSGKGPAECELAVALALREMIDEAKKQKLEHEVVSRCSGVMNGTLYSVLIKLKGKNVNAFVASWLGPLLWICQSPYRKFHKRKNWFIGINEILHSEIKQLNMNEVSFQTMRSSGPGGQHVNKTETAVRATHVPSGLFATCNNHRSQLQNKNEAVERLKEKYMDWQQSLIAGKGLKSERENNNNLERGNPTRTYKGGKFLKQ